MSGAETVVGLVLGVLPLLVSTAEHYDDVFRPFRRYKRFSKELKKFQQEFLGHKTVFHNECLLLLSTFTGVETANEMLRDQNHPLRKDFDLNKQLSNQLGASLEACQATIRLIMEELSSIQTESRSFEKAIPEDLPHDPNIYKAWRHRVAAKLKFCISENQLDERLNRLKNYNRVFGRLSAQTKELHNCQKVPDALAASPRLDRRRLTECTLVRDAAIQLYNALVEACASHPEHLAHFRLDPQPQHEDESLLPRIRFDMAFAQTLLQSGSNDADPIWFAIESMFNENLMKKSNLHSEEAKEVWYNVKENLRETLKRAFDQEPPAAPAKKKRQKVVRFASPPPNSQCRSIMPTPKLPPQLSMGNVPEASLPNFCVGRDFCSHVRRCSKWASNNADTCIGYLQKTGTCSHRVYYKHPKANSEAGAVVSLAQIFASISQVEPGQKQGKRMLQYESLRLARQLASAVLQFHATPILKESWRSEDVVFFGKASLSILQPHHPDMKTPHLNVRVRNRSRQTTQADQIPNTNPYTFSLGILLLELAHQAPFQILRISEDYNTLPSPSSDFTIADRLSFSLSSELGAPYAKMVRKCLSCDFGVGTKDLRDRELQEVFYRDVVAELERLEKAFAGLQICG